MKNNYLKANPRSVLDRKPNSWKSFLFLGFLLLIAHFSTFAQVPCVPKSAMTISTVDATSATTSNAKIRVSGLPANTYKVEYAIGGTISPGGFAAATTWTALDSGYVSKTLPSPPQNTAAAGGEPYTIRVWKDATCYTDSTFKLPYVNWNYTPEYVDIEATITRVPPGDIPMGQNVTITVAVKNNGNKDATGVEFTVAHAAGLTYVSNSTATGTYSDGTKKWLIGNLAKGVTVTLSMVYTVTTRGIKEVTAQNTALNQVDIDSSPTPNSKVEDDEGQICVSSHLDYCSGDEYTFAITSGNYTGITWQRSTDNGATFSAITGNTADYEVTGTNRLIIKKPGDYKYTRAASTGVCAYDGCCPVKVIPGLPPILSKPADVVICFGDPKPAITSANTQAGYTATTHTTYGIPTALPPFLSDQGVFKYQWYNNNGINNPSSTALAIDTTVALVTLPTAVGKYSYKLISNQVGHTSCVDTTKVNFTINELPRPKASSNSPICQEDPIKVSAINLAVNPTPGITWSWTGPNGFTKNNDSLATILNAQPVKAGKYIVTAAYTQNGKGCSNKDSVIVVVNLLPTKPIAQDTTYCAATTVKKLTAQGTAGNTPPNRLLWYVGGPATPYDSLKIPNDTSAIGYNVGPTPPNVVGTSSWYVRQIDGKGCRSHQDTATVVVKPKPIPPTVKDIAFCEGYPATNLTAKTSVGNYKLIWYGKVYPSAPDTIVTYPAPPTTPVGITKYYVTQFSSDPGQQCQSDTASFKVHIKSTPVAPGVTEPVYCLNDVAIPLAATTTIPAPTNSTAANYLKWYWNGATQPTPPTPPTTLAGATWAYVTQTSVYDTLNCESAQKPLKVLINPLPFANMFAVSALCIGDSSISNGMLVLNRFRDSDKVSWNMGSSYVVPPTSTAFAAIPTSGANAGIFASGLPNPSGASQDYSAQVLNSFGCKINLTVPLIAKNCTCPGGYCEPANITKTK